MPGCRPLTADELARVIEGAAGRFEARDRCLVTLGANCGFRISELLQLRLENVQIRGEVLGRVRVAARYMKGRRAARTVTLNKAARAAIADWIENMPRHGFRVRPETYLFRSRGAVNRHISREHAVRTLHRMMERAGIKSAPGELGTHSLRKTFAQGLYERLSRKHGGTLEVGFMVQRQLGHKSLSTTVGYLDFGAVDVEEAIMGMNFGAPDGEGDEAQADCDFTINKGQKYGRRRPVATA